MDYFLVKRKKNKTKHSFQNGDQYRSSVFFINTSFLLSVIPVEMETKDYKENAYSSGCYCNNCKST